jgi:DNA-binding beta-propeller fold protein YncE
MRRALIFSLLFAAPLAAQVAPIPTPTQLSGNPFYIRKNWTIGGAGNWDYLTIDPQAQRLYIAHGSVVQVVDIESGALLGEIGGLRQAHAIALDDVNTNGYISDGPAGAVVVFDRHSLKAQTTISVGCFPRSLAFEPRSRLLFAVCGSNGVNPAQPTPARRPAGNAPRPPRATGSDATGRNAAGSDEDNNFAGISHVIAIDTQNNAATADMAVSGDFRFAEADSVGNVYVTVAEAELMEYRGGLTHRIEVPAHIAKFDGPAIAAEADRLRAERAPSESGSPISMDWSDGDGRGSRAGFTTLQLPSTCRRPQGVGVDGKDLRLFVACENQSLLVLNATSSQVVASFITGPGDDVVGYDPDRNLIFSANGTGYGSLTIIQQDPNTDSYAVVQNLATSARARTLAVDPSTGLVYLVTDDMGLDLTPRGGFTTIKPTPVEGSFQVLVVGH